MRIVIANFINEIRHSSSALLAVYIFYSRIGTNVEMEVSGNSNPYDIVLHLYFLTLYRRKDINSSLSFHQSANIYMFNNANFLLQLCPCRQLKFLLLNSCLHFMRTSACRYVINDMGCILCVCMRSN